MIKGIGVDIVEIDRVEKAVKSLGKRFLNRIYAAHEIAYCRSGKRLKFPELAARFAAKEAYLKALGVGMRGIDLRSIEVVNNKLGKPELRYKGKVLKKAHITLSHGRDYAVAMVCLEK